MSQKHSRSSSSKTLAHANFNDAGSFQHLSSLWSQMRMRCRSHISSFSKASRRCNIPMLLKNRISPLSIDGVISCFSARKWSASNASAWASLRPGIPSVRGTLGACPTSNRRDTFKITFPSWKNKRARR